MAQVLARGDAVSDELPEFLDVGDATRLLIGQERFAIHWEIEDLPPVAPLLPSQPPARKGKIKRLQAARHSAQFRAFIKPPCSTTFASGREKRLPEFSTGAAHSILFLLARLGLLKTLQDLAEGRSRAA